MEIKPSFTHILTLTGKYQFIIVVFLLAFQNWGVLQLQKIPYPFPPPSPQIVDVLWYSLIASTVIASPFIYLERKSKVSPAKLCPDCDRPLEVAFKYKCPNCGDIKIGGK